MKFIKKLFFGLFLFSLLWFNISVLAASSNDTNFVIIPNGSSTVSNPNWSQNSTTTTTPWQAVKDISTKDPSWKQSLWDKYNSQAKTMDVWTQMATWIMNWDTIINYIAYLVRFLSQLALVIWAWMIIFAWYKYAMQVYWWKAQDWATAIKDAIIWIIVVTFAYAIIRIVSYAFL